MAIIADSHIMADGRIGLNCYEIFHYNITRYTNIFANDAAGSKNCVTSNRDRIVEDVDKYPPPS